MADKIVRFFHGKEADIDSKIEEGVINESDLVISSDTDKLIYIDETKTKHELGGGGDTETTQEHEVQLGSGGSIGGLNTGDTIPEGTSLDELIKMLTQKAVHPVYTTPGVTCRVSSGTSSGNYEVGTEINTTIQGVFTQNDAGALTSIEIKKGGSSVLSSPTSPVTTDAQVFTLGDETVTFTATATYAEGEVKDNNLGQPDPTGQIQAGSKTSSGVSFTGKRNLFYGTGVGAVPELSSEVVRGLNGKQLAPSAGTIFNINIEVGQQYVIFAYPATLRDVNQVMYVETNDTGMAASFTKNNISVQGANGAAGADYKVYSYGMATPAQAPMTFKVTI